MKVPTAILSTVGGLVLIGCAGTPPAEERMFDHFSRAGHVQTALILGDLNGARRPARWLAESADFPDGGDAWVDQLRRSARAVVEASSVDQAADAAGEMAASCAGCHGELGGPRFGTGPGVEEGGTVASHMVRHLWAMDRMWEGLIGGSDEAWDRGARVLADQEPEVRIPGGPSTAALARSLHREASSAMDAVPERRPAAYASLVKTCAACHIVTGVADAPGRPVPAEPDSR
jgi:mono/diheme cytochrome c family protein